MLRCTSRLVGRLVVVVGSAAALGVVRTSIAAQAAPASTQRVVEPAGAPPLFINFVHEPIRPGRSAAYHGILGTLARDYRRARIAAPWIELESLTGGSEMLSLNFFESFDEVERAVNAIGALAVSRPEIASRQEQLLSNVLSTSNALTVRRDGLGYRSATIDFSKMRVLRVTTVFVRPGHEADFAEVQRRLSAARQSDNGGAPWVVYEMEAGAHTPTYVILTPLGSLAEVGADISGRLALERAASDTTDQGLRDLVRSAYESAESDLYVVNPALSHPSDAFAAGNPAFWRPPAPRTTGGRRKESR